MSEKVEKQKPATDPKPAAELKPIEQWRDELKTNPVLFVGLLAAKGWAEGYECTQRDYEKAVDGFSKQPVRPTKKG